MKILHTADWHIGKTLAGYDRTAEFEAFFQRLIDTLDAERPDIMIVAGDVFDTATPSNSVASTYYNLICQIHTKFPSLKMVITSGNHDSPSYLSAPKEILKHFGANVSGSAARTGGQLDFSKMIYDYGCAIVCAAPYLRRGDIVAMGGESPSVAEFYRQALQYAARERGSRDIPIIATGHLTAIGATYNKTPETAITATRCDSVGGLENIDPEDFPEGFSYIALGHIHKPQKAGSRTNIRYSGAPIPFSFAEKDYKHSLTIVEFEGKDVSELRLIELPHTVKLRYIPEKLASLETVAQAIAQIPDSEEMLIEVNLEPALRSPETKAQIISEMLKGKKARFCGFRLVDSGGHSPILDNSHGITTVEQLQAMDPMAVVAEIYQSKAKQEPSERHIQMLREIIDEINAEN